MRGTGAGGMCSMNFYSVLINNKWPSPKPIQGNMRNQNGRGMMQSDEKMKYSLHMQLQNMTTQSKLSTALEYK